MSNLGHKHYSVENQIAYSAGVQLISFDTLLGERRIVGTDQQLLV
jgi:hypothetical protein